jgi:hypothetical protein
VDSSGPGTRGTVTKEPKRYSSGQEAAPSQSGTSSGGTAATGDYWNTRRPGAVPGGTGSTTVVAGSSYQRTEGVAFPLSGRGGFGQLGGFEYGQRMGFSPDAYERYPYGVAYRTQAEATDAFYTLDPDYQAWLKNLSQHPNVGTSGSTGRMLWERISRLAAERTEMGDPASPQQIAAELANSLGVAPPGGSDSSLLDSRSTNSSGGGGYSGGGGGGGGSVALTNPSSARGLLMQTMQGALGRIPTDAEYRLFIKTLNEAEMDAPRTVDVEGDLAVQSGGVDPGVVAMDFVEGLPEFNSAAGQRTFDSFMQVLGA